MTTPRLALIVLSLTPVSAFAQEPAVEFELDSPFFTKYVWRGLNVVDGPVWQPSVTASYGAWSLNLWGNFEIDDSSDYGPGFGSGRGKFTEVDTTVAYGATSGDWDWTAGYIRYDYPNTGFEETSELFVGATHASEWSPSIELYTDIDAVHGTAALLGVSKVLTASEKGELEVSFGLGYGDSEFTAYYLGTGKAGLTDASVGLTYIHTINSTSSVTVYGSFSALLSKDYVPGNGKRDNFVFGVGVTVGF
jgi:hypothetical protein